MHCLFKRHKTRMGRIPTITDVVSNLDEEEFVECKADEILDHPYGRVQLVRHCASEPSSGVISFIEEIMIFKDAVAEVRGWMAPRMAKKYLREPHLVAKVVPQGLPPFQNPITPSISSVVVSFKYLTSKTLKICSSDFSTLVSRDGHRPKKWKRKLEGLFAPRVFAFVVRLLHVQLSTKRKNPKYSPASLPPNRIF
eukprot:c16289_g1_i1.p1 GENE.c16289_g1_i1~~c16289_g1_i1.p1  ORF type:complete len:196 (+),score=36.39 c16289_g1_i1:93-680(+)